jgi:hypothetical protein
MMQEDGTQKKVRRAFSRRTVIIVICTAIVLAVACFVLVVVLPRPEGPLFKDPLRSLLTGVGLLGVCCPLLIVGSILGKRAARSPYFEETFITTVVNIFGFLCLIVGLICIGLSIYALVKWVLGSG